MKASTSSSNDKNSTSLSNDKKSTSSFNDKKSTIQQPSEDNSIKASSSSQQGTSPKVMMDYVTVTQKIVSKTKTVTKSFGSRQDSNDQQNRLNNYTSQRSQPLQYSLRSPSSSTSTFNSSQITSLPKFSTMTSST
ncbi:10614_t:CDS:1, partial [Scutellospora calospora]